MKRARIEELTAQYRHALLDDIIPFWLKHGLPRNTLTVGGGEDNRLGFPWGDLAA